MSDHAITFLRARLASLRETHPELFEDDDTASLVLESETDFHEVLGRLVEAVAHSEGVASAIAARVKELGQRQARYETRGDKLRGLVHELMDAAGQTKVSLPTATLSIRAGTAKVVVIDEAGIPDEFWKTTRSLDKAALSAALKAGTTVDGAALGNGNPSLSIRTK